jgi:hypothetical protein
MFNKVELEKLLGIEHESLPANQEGFLKPSWFLLIYASSAWLRKIRKVLCSGFATVANSGQPGVVVGPN